MAKLYRQTSSSPTGGGGGTTTASSPRTPRALSFMRAATATRSGRLFGGMDDDGVMEVERRAFSCRRPIPHNSRVKVVWDQFIGILILYTVVSLPLELAFDPWPRALALTLDTVVVAGFVLNVIVQFRTAVELSDEIITDWRGIALHYVRFWFWWDMVAAVPWDLLLQPLTGDSGPAYDYVHLLRMLRLVRLFRHDQFNLTWSQTTMRFMKLVAYAACMAHWLGCMWFLASRHEHFTGVGFLADASLVGRGFRFQYIISLEWGFWSLVTVASELRPDSTLQAFLAIITILAGLLLFAAIIGNIELLLDQTSAASTRFQVQVNRLNDFFSHHVIPSQLRRLLMNHVHHLYRTTKGVDESELVGNLPTETRNRVYRALYKDGLSHCYFFEESDEAFIDALCCEIKPQIALDGDLIIRQGALGDEMYIIHRGEAEAVDLRTGEVHSTIPEGQFFGEIALFSSAKRTISVRACGYTEVFVLTKVDFLRVLSFFPAEEKRFLAVAQKRVQTSERVALQLDRKQSYDPTMTVWGADEVKRFFEEENITHLESVFDVDNVAAFIAKFDTNKDGVLDAKERRHIVQYLTSKADRFRSLKSLCGDDGDDGDNGGGIGSNAKATTSDGVAKRSVSPARLGGGGGGGGRSQHRSMQMGTSLDVKNVSPSAGWSKQLIMKQQDATNGRKQLTRTTSRILDEYHAQKINAALSPSHVEDVDERETPVEDRSGLHLEALLIQQQPPIQSQPRSSSPSVSQLSGFMTPVQSARQILGLTPAESLSLKQLDTVVSALENDLKQVQGDLVKARRSALGRRRQKTGEQKMLQRTQSRTSKRSSI